MQKLEKIQIIKNVSSSWIALAANVVVGIFLSPFILHRLGDTAFGVWVLIFSITGYYGVFDFGIRSSIVRYVSKCLASGNKEELAKFINTSLFAYSCVGAACLLLTFVLGSYVDTLFRIPVHFHETARWLLLIVGAAVALGFPLGVAGGFLEGLQRFDVLNGTNIAATLGRALLIVIALRHGQGLLAVTLVTAIVPLISSAIRGIFALHVCPLLFGWQYVDRSTFRKMAGYSSITLIIIVAGRLKFKTDEIVIGSMVSAVAITYFNVGARIVDYAADFVSGLAQVFVPMASRSDTTGNMDELRRIFVLGNRFCALTIFPICAALIILGRSVIEVWVGKKYVVASYPVLVIMILAITLMWAQGASPRILLGIGRHGTWAAVTFVEGVLNLILSILLVRPYGIIGDSLGTAIPLCCSMVFFMPSHLCRRLGVRMSVYLREAYMLPLMLCFPMVLTMLLMKNWFVPHTYLHLAFHLSVAGVIYGAGLAWAFIANRLTELSSSWVRGSSDNAALIPLDSAV